VFVGSKAPEFKAVAGAWCAQIISFSCKAVVGWAPGSAVFSIQHRHQQLQQTTEGAACSLRWAAKGETALAGTVCLHRGQFMQ
jgi:hypothetical protein